MVYDAARQRLVMHCAGTGNGAAGGTWSWNGAKWTRLTNDGPWPQRKDFAITYDKERDRVVLFGGTDPGGQTLADTWEFDGAHWRLVDAAGAPGRTKGTLVYDDARQTNLLTAGKPAAGSASDVWEWDGMRWALLLATGSPGLGEHSLVTYDSVHDRLIAVPSTFNGISGTTTVWQFAAGQWTKVATSTALWTSNGRSMTYDPQRDRSVAFIGSTDCVLQSYTDGDRWPGEFNGQTWAQNSQTPLGRRSFLPIVYDAARATCVLFGGAEVPCGCSPGRRFSETWEWNGAAWSLWHDPRPTGRSATVGAFSAAIGKTVIFSGAYTIQCPENTVSDYKFRDTWLWNDSGWVDASAQAQPPDRKWSAMAYDSTRGRVVLYGGTSRDTAYYSDTWFYDQAGWSKFAGSGPPIQIGHSLSYDPARDRTVMIGNDMVWELDGATWSDRTPQGTRPSARTFAAAAFDPMRAEVLYCGGGSVNPFDTWSWNGQAWTKLAPVGAIPAARQGHMMCTDPERAVILMAGNDAPFDFDSEADRGETWEWNGTNWKQVGASGYLPQQGLGAMVYDSVRHAVMRFALDSVWQWVPGSPPSFVESPRDSKAFAGRTVLLECTTAQMGPVSFQWRKNGAPISDGGRIRGSRAMRLVFDPVAFDDADCYDVVCTSACGTVLSAPACLSVYCPADYNQDGMVNGDDVDYFVGLFVAGGADADFNGDGYVNGNDFDFFSWAFAAGC